MVFRIRRPSPALMVASIALVFAMSGTAVAAITAHSGDALIIKRTLSGNRLRLNTVTGAEIKESTLGQVPKAGLAVHVPALVWHNLTLINDWANYWAPVGSPRRPGYAIDVQGVVHLRGAITQTVTPGFHDFAFIPKAARPAVRIFLPAAMVAGTPGAISIAHDGEMDVREDVQFSDAEQFTSLEGITYSLH